MSAPTYTPGDIVIGRMSLGGYSQPKPRPVVLIRPVSGVTWRYVGLTTVAQYANDSERTYFTELTGKKSYLWSPKVRYISLLDLDKVIRHTSGPERRTLISSVEVDLQDVEYLTHKVPTVQAMVPPTPPKNRRQLSLSTDEWLQVIGDCVAGSDMLRILDRAQSLAEGRAS